MSPFERGDNLLLIGSMGSGKSSIARELTQLTGRRCVDTDRIAIGLAGGRSITQIFQEEGEARFRELENAALESLRSARRLIIATGGGIVERPENTDALRALGCVVWLHASDDVLFARVSRNTRRPLLQTADPRSTLGEISARRRPLYQAAAHCTVDTSDLSHAEAAAAVLAGARTFFHDVDGTHL